MVRAGDFAVLLCLFELSFKNVACKCEDLVYCPPLIGVFVFYFPITT